ncbi:hypothetical protein E4U44_006338 [Claviceps purpurea]|nr:hypothetical protein E4U44_006338 [Claviceps purpurea]
MDVDETDVGVMDFNEMDFDVMDVDVMDVDVMDFDVMDFDEMDFDEMDVDEMDVDEMDVDVMDFDVMDFDVMDFDEMDFDVMDVDEMDIDEMDVDEMDVDELESHIFALYGQDIYNLSIRAVQAAHENTSAKISAFHAQAANTSAHTTHLYNNISYPLSATLCQSENFPSASLGRHMRTLHKRLSAAETELDRLNEEWKRCVGEEARILSARAGTGSAGGGGGESGGVARKKKGELVARIDDVVRKRGEEIDELDEEYRHLLWTESNRMIQAMMAD